MFPVKRIARPRVLFVIPGEDRGSSMVFARRQAETLNQRGGAEVVCFYLRSRTSVTVLFREARRLREVVRTFGPDVLHAHFGTVTALFTVLLSGNVPVVITYRGSDLNLVPTARGIRAWTGRLLSQLAALGAARIFCVSDGLRRNLWWKQALASVLPSGVDTSAFQPVPRDTARQQLGWPPEDLVILFNAGHDAANKRLDLAEAAFQLVRNQISNARLKVLRGMTDPELIPLLMNAADCLMLTSDAEGSPTVVQEALATNLPVVSVDVGDVQERLRGIRHSMITESTPEAISEAVIQVLAAGERSNGRTRSDEICSRRIADELTQVYRELTARNVSRETTAWNTTFSSQ